MIQYTQADRLRMAYAHPTIRILAKVLAGIAMACIFIGFQTDNMHWVGWFGIFFLIVAVVVAVLGMRWAKEYGLDADAGYLSCAVCRRMINEQTMHFGVIDNMKVPTHVSCAESVAAEPECSCTFCKN